MDPIGASDTWQWHGYETSWVKVNGASMQSVSGGAHWGGGIWINTKDHALFGRLNLNLGVWEGWQILPVGWIANSVTPSPCNPAYGYLWWLNYKTSISAVADSSAFAAKGAGGHDIFIWPARSIVIVVRWCDDLKAVIDSILTEIV